MPGIKRKAIAVILTVCHNPECGKSWYDKIYKDKLPHRVICPYCNTQRGEAIVLDDMNQFSWEEWGLSRDIAADGRLGGAYNKPGRKSKIMNREEFESIYGKQNL